MMTRYRATRVTMANGVDFMLIRPAHDKPAFMAFIDLHGTVDVETAPHTALRAAGRIGSVAPRVYSLGKSGWICILHDDREVTGTKPLRAGRTMKFLNELSAKMAGAIADNRGRHQHIITMDDDTH